MVLNFDYYTITDVENNIRGFLNLEDMWNVNIKQAIQEGKDTKNGFMVQIKNTILYIDEDFGYVTKVFYR